jgi:hypothetical protein
MSDFSGSVFDFCFFVGGLRRRIFGPFLFFLIQLLLAFFVGSFEIFKEFTGISTEIFGDLRILLDFLEDCRKSDVISWKWRKF